jgi:hypothetical protein
VYSSGFALLAAEDLAIWAPPMEFWLSRCVYQR